MRKGHRSGVYIFIAFILFTIVFVNGQDVHIAGTIKDEDGKPVANAEINLTGKKLSAKSDSVGQFLVTNNPSTVNGFQSDKLIKLKGNRLIIPTINSGNVFVGLYDISGRKLAVLNNGSWKYGSENQVITFDNQGTGVQILKVQVGPLTRVFKIAGQSRLIIQPGEEQEPLQKSTSIIDVLEVTADGFQKKRVTVSSYIDTLDFVLQKTVEGPYVIFNDLSLAYDTVDAGKTKVKIPMDRGNKLLLNLRLENVGDENALSVTCSLSTADPYITVTKSVSGFNNIEKGTDTLNFEPYAVEVSESIPPAHSVKFHLLIKDSWGGVWRDSCIYVVNPFIIESQNIDDDTIPDSYGNGNKIVDPNEIIEYTPRIQNKSFVNIENVQAALFSKTDSIIVNDSNDIWAFGNFWPNDKNLPKWDYVFQVLSNYFLEQVKFDLFVFGEVNGQLQKWIIPISIPTEYSEKPVFNKVNDTTINEMEIININILALDPDGDDLNYEMLEFPDGAMLTNTQFSWTPNYKQSGIHNIKIFVKDNSVPQLSDTTSFQIIVTDVNLPPEFQPIENKIVWEGDKLTFSINAIDVNSDNLKYSALNVPPGATLSEHLFSWTPDFNQSGEYTATFMAVDNGTQNLSDTISVEINVKGATEIIDQRDNTVYQVVAIGNQNWMAENLAYLPQVDDVNDGSEDVADGKYYYVYDYQPTGGTEADEIVNAKADSNYQKYGVLYNWNAAMDGSASSNLSPSGVRGVCPEGWHLPSDAEWKELEIAIGMSLIEVDDTGWRGTPEGEELKSISFGGTNNHGFTALPAGCRGYSFRLLGSNSFFWSATEDDVSYSWYRLLHSGYDGVYRKNLNKNNGYSVRCVQNTE
ncbi:MAG: hypothetical protein HQK83_11750 [Fibrobacteria bacterium]|nr:hypothetical protein [Fibrobacteria bacterium]